LQSRCIPSRLQPQDIGTFNQIVQRSRPLRKGDHAFLAADRFRSIFIIRHGAIKTYYLTEEGEEQVTGFFTVGDCFGFDGISIMKHTNSARAMVRTQLCEIPFEQLEQLCTRIHSLQHYAYQLASQQILREQKLMQLLGKRSAEARVAFLLLNYITRANQDQPDDTETLLPMTRYDIANYLGLSVETVSRILSRLQLQGAIRLRARAVAILSRRGLGETAQLPDQLPVVQVASL
jgi:CRP/FNR family transcriptional regulator